MALSLLRDKAFPSPLVIHIISLQFPCIVNFLVFYKKSNICNFQLYRFFRSRLKYLRSVLQLFIYEANKFLMQNLKYEYLKNNFDHPCGQQTLVKPTFNMFRYGFSCQRKTPRVLVFNHLPIFLNRFHQHETTKNSIADSDLCFLQLVNTHLFIDLTDSRKSVAFIYKTSNFNIFLLLGTWSCEQRKRHDNLHCKLIFPMHAWSATCGETILISCMKNYIICNFSQKEKSTHLKIHAYLIPRYGRKLYIYPKFSCNSQYTQPTL